MKYRYTAIYSLKGIALPPDGTIEVATGATGFQAILTSDPDEFAFEGDRSLAVRRTMLRVVFHAEALDLQQAIPQAIGQIRASRKRRFEGRPFLVLIGRGEVADFQPSVQEDTDDFVVCFDGADTAAIREKFAPAVTAIILSLLSECQNLIATTRAAESVTFFRHDGKPIYSFTGSPHLGDLYVSSPLREEQLRAVSALYPMFTKDQELRRVQRLLQSSLESEDDKLRSFIAAWAALEILINKLYVKYAGRRGDVDRRGLTAKFGAVVARLAAAGDSDLHTMHSAKKTRDHLFHGQPVDEGRLPVKGVRDVAGKYLRLYIEEERRRAISDRAEAATS